MITQLKIGRINKLIGPIQKNLYVQLVKVGILVYCDGPIKPNTAYAVNYIFLYI